MTGVWLDVSPLAADYQVEFNPRTCQYRHRLRRLIRSDDPSVIVIRAIDCAAWTQGKPPPYPT